MCSETKPIGPVLIVTAKSVIPEWKNEIKENNHVQVYDLNQNVSSSSSKQQQQDQQDQNQENQ